MCEIVGDMSSLRGEAEGLAGTARDLAHGRKE